METNSNWQGLDLEDMEDLHMSFSETVSLGNTVCGQVTFICMYGAELYQYKFI
jgi:hypothetical protein